MIQRQRRQMMESINELTNRSDCSEAVILQRRPPWVIAVFAVVFAVAMFVIPQDLGAVVRGGIAGGMAGGVMVAVTESFLLGRIGNDVVLTRASRWKPTKATVVMSQWPTPLTLTVSNGMLQRKVKVGAESYVMSRAFSSRLDDITS